jgi:hypothetical protein
MAHIVLICKAMLINIHCNVSIALELEIVGSSRDQLLDLRDELGEVIVDLMTAGGVLPAEVVGWFPLMGIVLHSAVVPVVRDVPAVVVEGPLAEHPVAPVDAPGQGLLLIELLSVLGEDVPDGVRFLVEVVRQNERLRHSWVVALIANRARVIVSVERSVHLIFYLVFGVSRLL